MSAEMEGVVVKPLEWSEKGWPLTALSVIGVYRIWAGRDVWLNDELIIDDPRPPTVEDAIAAAQADFNTRILSAVTLAPSLTEAETIERCAKVAEQVRDDNPLCVSADYAAGHFNGAHRVAAAIRSLSEPKP